MMIIFSEKHVTGNYGQTSKAEQQPKNKIIMEAISVSPLLITEDGVRAFRISSIKSYYNAPQVDMQWKLEEFGSNYKACKPGTVLSFTQD